MGLALGWGRAFQMFFVDDGGAGEDVVPHLSALVEAKGQEGGDEEEGAEEETGGGFESGAEEGGEEVEGGEGQGTDGAEAAGAFAEGTAEEDFTDAEVDPEGKELDFGGVAEGGEEVFVGLGHVHAGGFAVLKPLEELVDPFVELEETAGVGNREEDSPDEDGGEGGAEDEVEGKGEAADAEAGGGHGAVVGKDGIEDGAGLRFWRGIGHGWVLGLCLSEFEGAEGVVHEHGDGHGADAAGDGGHVAGFGGNGVVVGIADEAVAPGSLGGFDAVDADVDNGGAVFDHVGGDEVGAPDGGDEEVGLSGDGGEVGGAGMTDGDGGVAGEGFAHHEEGGGFADDLAAPEDDDVFTFGLDAAAGDEFDDAGGGAGDETGIVFLAEFADVEGVEAIDVFVGGHAVEGFGFVEVFGKGGLHEDAADFGVGVEGVDAFKEGFAGDVGGEEVELTPDADTGGGLFLFADIGDRGRIFPDADKGDCGFRAAEGADFGGEFFDDGFGDGVAVDALHGGGLGLWSFSGN